MRIVLIGPPGSGKGTQSKRLAERLGIQHISSGALFRIAVLQGSTLGKAAESFMKNGLLVPDELATEIVARRVKQSACENGFVLDGFPRNLTQAQILDNYLERIGRPIQYVFVIEVNEAEVVDRITGRRMDPDTGNIYHTKFDPPPDDIKLRLIQRPDDTVDTAKKRLAEYNKETFPIISFYNKRGIVHKISGLGKPDIVENRLLEHLE